MDLSQTLQLVQIAASFAAVVIFVAMLKADIRVLRHDMATVKLRQDGLNESFGVLTTIMTQVAVQDTRIKSMEDNISELRHGKGYIRD